MITLCALDLQLLILSRILGVSTPLEIASIYAQNVKSWLMLLSVCVEHRSFSNGVN